MDDDRFYCPNLINEYCSFLNSNLMIEENKFAYTKNIGYSLQYLQYLVFTLENTNLHNIIYLQTIKTFIITGCSIVESILWILLKEKNLTSKIEWKVIEHRETNKFQSEGKDFKFEVIHSERLDTPQGKRNAVY